MNMKAHLISVKELEHHLHLIFTLLREGRAHTSMREESTEVTVSHGPV